MADAFVVSFTLPGTTKAVHLCPLKLRTIGGNCNALSGFSGVWWTNATSMGMAATTPVPIIMEMWRTRGTPNHRKRSNDAKH